jgi:hypothetical protein
MRALRDATTLPPTLRSLRVRTRVHLWRHTCRRPGVRTAAPAAGLASMRAAAPPPHLDSRRYLNIHCRPQRLSRSSRRHRRSLLYALLAPHLLGPPVPSPLSSSVPTAASCYLPLGPRLSFSPVPSLLATLLSPSLLLLSLLRSYLPTNFMLLLYIYSPFSPSLFSPRCASSLFLGLSCSRPPAHPWSVP